jgi:hypothetical protein
MSQSSAVLKNTRAIEGGVGPARALKLASIKTPTESGDVLIQVAAAIVNYLDIIQREGRYPLLSVHTTLRPRGAYRCCIPMVKKILCEERHGTTTLKTAGPAREPLGIDCRPIKEETTCPHLTLADANAAQCVMS